MAPTEFRAIRLRLGLSARRMAEALRLGKDGGRMVRRWESGESRISGPTARLMEAFDAGQIAPEADSRR